MGKVRQNLLLGGGEASIPSGNAGHMNMSRANVVTATADLASGNSRAEWLVGRHAHPARRAKVRIIEGEGAKRLGREEKWELLSPFLTQHGREGIAYATLQAGMEYFIGEAGYIAYTSVQHPLFARQAKRIAFSDPICAPEDLPTLLRSFLARDGRAAFCVISEECAEVLRPMGFKVNCIGYEPQLPIQSYNTQGNWKELDLIKRARNEARREGITIREENGESLTFQEQELKALSAKWVSSKKINDREIWLYARRPIFGHEEDVRKFVAYDPEGRIAGFVFYDPMYRDGKVFGYSANIVRCDERRYGRLATAVHMVAAEKFKAEGKECLNLLLAPFANLEDGNFNDDWGAKLFFKLSARFGNQLYNFKGLSFHKSKYRGVVRPLYYASNSFLPSADIYLAFASAGLADGCLATFGKFLRGMLPAGRNGKAHPGRATSSAGEHRLPGLGQGLSAS
jgi:Phosphatidylglycerol lysyltransferase, C-terminal